MHDHLEEGDGRNADRREVVGVGSPWMRVVDGFLLRGGIIVEGVLLGIYKLDGVLQLWDVY